MGSETNARDRLKRRAWLGFVSSVIAVAALAATACGDGGSEATSAPATSTIAAEEALGERLASQLQDVLDAAVADPDVFPGAILRVSGPGLGTWTGTAGMGEIASRTPMRPDDKFRAGSIMKTFISVVVLQLVEEGAFSLDDPLPAVLPESSYSRFPDGDEITVRMLLNHTSGLPEWLSPAVIGEIVANPGKVWDVTEFLDLSAAQPPSFSPGSGYAYSNTDYNVLGLIIEGATDRSWREEVAARVIGPLDLPGTLLPEPGDVSIPGNYARGYGASADALVDFTGVDPSMAGAAGGGALVTSALDLARFLGAVLSGELFEKEETLQEMLAFIDAPGEGGQVGYGLGLQRYLLPGGIEVIGHLGSTAGYVAFMGYLPASSMSIVAALNSQGDPTPVLLPAVEILTGPTSQ